MKAKRALCALSILALSVAPLWAAEEKGEEEKWDVRNPGGEWTTVTIDTDETTWSNVDVSPDGRTIVFDMLGDVYQVPITGGEAKALTEGIDWSYQPRFSPDGKRIAFISDRAGGDNLWVMGADGSDPEALTEEGTNLVHNPAWSPDGDYLAVRKGFMSGRSIPAGEIWVVHAAGGGGLQVVERPGGRDAQKSIAEPAFSPDGRYLYYSQDTTAGRVWQYNKDATGQIFVIQRLDRETGEVETLVDGAGGAIRPTPSPDGKTLAFVRRTPAMTSALYLKDLESGREWPIYDRLERDLQESSGSEGSFPAFAWTPDGESIVFWSAGKIHRIDVDSREVAAIPIHVRDERQVQKVVRFPVEVAPETFTVRMLRWTQVTPDGRHAVFQALGRIWVKDLATGRQWKLTGDAPKDYFEYYPAVSRDGKQVAYTTWDDEELGSVRVTPIAGGAERVLTDQPGHYVEPAFSSDGGKLAYRKITGGYLLSGAWSMEPGLYVVSTSQGKPARVVNSGFEPHFGERDDRLYFSTGGEDDETLVLKSVELDGKDERTHFTGTKVTEYEVSPDGRWVAFTTGYRAYVAPFPRIGKPVTIGAGESAYPVRQVSKRAGEYLHWSADSSEVAWSHGPHLFRRPLAETFDFLDGAPEELPEPVAEGLDLSFEQAADRPEGVIALVGGKVVTMRDAEERQEVIEDGVVVVRGNRIAAVGRRGEVEVPADATVFDVTGKTVLPGLVDAHAHGAMGRSEILPEQNWIQLSNLAFGVTTIHDPSNDTSEIFAAAELQRTGHLVAPRIYSTGTILYGARGPGYHAQIDSLEDARFHVERLQELGAISVKSYNQPRRDQRQQVLAAARELGMMVVPEGGMKFQHNMNMVVDGHTGIEHAIPLANLYDDVRQLWAATEVGYTPTFGVAYGGLMGEEYWYAKTEVWNNERLMRYVPRFVVEPRAMRRQIAPDLHYNHINVAREAKALRDLGVTVHIGAHGQREGLAAHWEMWMMEQGGFTPWEALRAGTIDGAAYVGLDGDIGSLEAGKLADLFVVDGDPLADLSRSEHVAYTMIGGRLYDVTTMNQVAPDQVERAELFFEKEGGDTIHPETAGWLETKKERHGWVHGH